MENLTILPSLLKYLYDFREAELVIEPEDLPGLSQQSAKTCERCSNVKTAFIVEKPDNTALALLYTKENNYDKFNREIFSDPDAAINWLCGN
jgi:PAB1-binding protein PBP1